MPVMGVAAHMYEQPGSSPLIAEVLDAKISQTLELQRKGVETPHCQLAQWVQVHTTETG